MNEAGERWLISINRGRGMTQVRPIIRARLLFRVDVTIETGTKARSPMMEAQLATLAAGNIN